jgi:hypothetical protein
MGNFGSIGFGSTLFGGPGGGGGAGAVLLSEIIYAAYRLIGVLARPGRGYSASEQWDGIEALNTLIDAWGIDPLMVYSILPGVFNLVPGQQAYTIGIDPSGATVANFAVARPVRIHKANILSQLASPQVARIPLEILDVDGWANVRVQATPSTIPQYLYDDYDDPLSKLYLYPYPSAAAQLEIYAWKVLSLFATVADVVKVPPGYLRALKTNLAVELAPRYPERAVVSPLLIQQARESLAVVKAHNAPTSIMTCEGITSNNKKSTWNYITGLPQ